MSKLTLIATAAFGIESIVSDELKGLGIADMAVNNGRVSFTGDESDIARCNINLRCADRLLLSMAEYRAMDFEELFQGALSVPWEKFIPVNGKMHVVGKSVRSKLHSVPDCQAIVKKAVVEAMRRKYRRDIFPEDGPVYKIEVSMLDDTATLSLDTSGAGLHKRGYRTEQGEAPIRETLAAAIIRLSKWRGDRIFADPLCGSGTIPIEAAMYALNIAPGMGRKFAAEEWGFIPAKLWKNGRDEAKENMRDVPLNILASDMDKKVFDIARDNAMRAGVSKYITFQKKPIEEFSSSKPYGCIVCNPPYGERMGSDKEIKELYRKMGEVFSNLEEWSYFIISSHEEFEKHFGRKSDKNRKLYNGKLKTYLYSYFGKFPPRKAVNQEGV